MSELDRLRWRCRRGTLELDLILIRFLDEQYPGLTPAERELFTTLLELPDDVLADLVTTESVTDARFAPIMERLRQC
jgi:antitoxin CptB